MTSYLQLPFSPFLPFTGSFRPRTCICLNPGASLSILNLCGLMVEYDVYSLISPAWQRNKVIKRGHTKRDEQCLYLPYFNMRNTDRRWAGMVLSMETCPFTYMENVAIRAQVNILLGKAPTTVWTIFPKGYERKERIKGASKKQQDVPSFTVYLPSPPQFLINRRIHAHLFYTSLTLGSMSSVCGVQTTPAAIADEVMKSNIYAYPLPCPALVSFIWGNGCFYFPVCHVTILRVSRMCFIHLCNERHRWWKCCGWEHEGAFSSELAPVLVQVQSKILGNLMRAESKKVKSSPFEKRLNMQLLYKNIYWADCAEVPLMFYIVLTFRISSFILAVLDCFCFGS